MITKISVKRLIVVIPVLALVFLSFSCDGPGTESSKRTVRIGAILPLSGNLQYIGEEEKNGMNMALEDLNSDPESKYQFEIVYEDSKGQAKEAVSIFQKLVSVDEIEYIISSTSPVSNVLLPLAEKNDILLFAITIEPKVTESHKNVFRIWPNSGQEWEILLKHFEDQQVNTVGLYYSNVEFGLMGRNFFTKRLTEIGKKLVYSEPVNIGEKDVRSIVVKHKDEQVDRILLLTYPGDTIPLVRQIREMDIKTPFVGYLTFTYDFLRKAVVKEADGTIFTAPEYMLASRSDFERRYEENFGNQPNWNVSYSYDAVNIIGGIINRTENAKIEEFADKIHEIRTFKGVTGTITVKENNDSEVSINLLQIQN